MILTEYRDEVRDDLAQVAAAVRALSHRNFGQIIPAPVAYRLFDELQLLGQSLPQMFDRVGSGLVRSLREDDVYESDDSDPVTNVLGALAHLRTAAQHAEQLGEALRHAQNAISTQGCRPAPVHATSPSGE